MFTKVFLSGIGFICIILSAFGISIEWAIFLLLMWIALRLDMMDNK